MLPSIQFRLDCLCDKEKYFVNIILIVVHVSVSAFLILLVLLHAGRGGGLSDMFGGSVGGSMAGSTVMEKNLDRATILAGLIFMFTTSLLAMRLQ